MVVVPPFDTPPVTMPDDDPTVATAVLLLVQVPPVYRSPRAIVLPLQTTEAPLIAPGVWFTVTTNAAPKPHPLTYDIVVVPAVTGITVPEELISATEVLLLDHVPARLPASDKVIVEPVHTEVLPRIAPGAALTTNVAIAEHPEIV